MLGWDLVCGLSQLLPGLWTPRYIAEFYTHRYFKSPGNASAILSVDSGALARQSSPGSSPGAAIRPLGQDEVERAARAGAGRLQQRRRQISLLPANCGETRSTR